MQLPQMSAESVHLQTVCEGTDLRASPRAVHMPLSWCRKVSAFSVATLMSPISLHTPPKQHQQHANASNFYGMQIFVSAKA